MVRTEQVVLLLAFVMVTRALSSALALGAPRSPRDGLFSHLDLDRPGLQAVQDAVRRRDNRRAERELLEYFRERRTPRWDYGWPLASAPREVVLGRARAVLAHDFTFLNRRARLASRIDWRADPLGDPEWTWALNRHGVFDNLIAAYRLTGEEEYARELDALIADWIRENPPPERRGDSDSVAWRTVEAGYRMSGPWIRAWEALKGSPSLRIETRLAMISSFVEHAQYLERNPSGRNGEAAPPGRSTLHGANGLAHVGAFFPEFRQAAEWRQAAVERLETEMRRQVYPDGGHHELSTLYQQVALEGFAQPLRLLAIAPDLEFSDGYLAGVGRMLRWNLQLARPDGTLPQLNDADRVTVSRLPEFVNDLNGILEPRVAAARERWRSGQVPSASLALPFSGLFVMRDGGQGPEGRYLCIDAAPFGAAQPHEDRLNVELYAFGRTLLVDPGRYLSTSEGAWFRGPAAHNTVLVDGMGQNRRGTPADRWVIKTPPADRRWFSANGADFFEGVYDEGYGPANDQVVKHVRQVLFVKPSYWVVWDLLLPDRGAARPHRFEQLWHFPPGRTRVEEARQLVATAEEGRANLAILPVGMGSTVRVLEGGSGDGAADGKDLRTRPAAPSTRRLVTPSLQGWYSPEYGHREPAPVVVHTREAVPPVLFEIVLFPYGAGARPAFEAERVPVTSNGEAVPPDRISALRFRYGRFHDLVLMTHDARAVDLPRQAADLRTDAEAAILRFDPTGRPVRFIGRGVSTAVYSGQVLFAAERRQEDVDVAVMREP